MTLRPALEVIRDVLRQPGGKPEAFVDLRRQLTPDQRWQLAIVAAMALEWDDLLWLTDRLGIAAAQRRQAWAVAASEADAAAMMEALEHEAAAHASRGALAAVLDDGAAD